MTGRKLERGAFEAQFHNHDHYEDSDEPHEAIPEWWEIPKTAPVARARGGKTGIVDKALAIARSKTNC